MQKNFSQRNLNTTRFSLWTLVLKQVNQLSSSREDGPMMLRKFLRIKQEFFSLMETSGVEPLLLVALVMIQIDIEDLDLLEVSISILLIMISNRYDILNHLVLRHLKLNSRQVPTMLPSWSNLFKEKWVSSCQNLVILRK